MEICTMQCAGTVDIDEGSWSRFRILDRQYAFLSTKNECISLRLTMSATTAKMFCVREYECLIRVSTYMFCGCSAGRVQSRVLDKHTTEKVNTQSYASFHQSISRSADSVHTVRSKRGRKKYGREEQIYLNKIAFARKPLHFAGRLAPLFC